jgi:hypothetical protein
LPNEQKKLSDLDRMQLAVLTLTQENAQLRQQLVAAEYRLFQVKIQVTYGNPGEKIQVEADGTLLRLPPGFGEPPKPEGLAGVPLRVEPPA